MSSIMERIILISTLEWGIKDLVYKLSCENTEKLPTSEVGEWIHEFYDAVSNRGWSCMYCFQFISKKGY